ncbi:MAG: molybdenum cofactor biosynthesis protein B [Desulfovibrionales bacterium]
MNTIILSSSEKIQLAQGQFATLTRTPADLSCGMPNLLGQNPALSVGMLLHAGTDDAAFQIVSRGWLPGSLHAPQAWWLKTLRPLELHQDQEFTLHKQGVSLAWITLSDKGFCGERDDSSGPLIESLVRDHLCLCFSQGFLIPDSASRLKTLLHELALAHRFDLILTSGGTGVGPRDVTPEATAAVLEKSLPGFERCMTATSLSKTPHGMISRARAGTLGTSLIVNLPGSSRAVEENLSAVLPAVKHTIEKIQGDTADCGRP